MQWDLTRLYKSFSDPAFAADMAAAEALTDKLSALFAAPAADTAEQLCALINTFNELHSLTAIFDPAQIPHNPLVFEGMRDR